MIIKLTKEQVKDLLSMLFVGSMGNKDSKNKKLCERLRQNITEQFNKELEREIDKLK